MARTEEQLRAWYGKHPAEGRRCEDDECVHCEMRDLFAEIDRLREYPAKLTEALRGARTPHARDDLDHGYNDGIGRAIEIVSEVLS